jgi:outer membrane murein-binding lipoprotein Lpp
MKYILIITAFLLLGGCASKSGFDQKSYDRQNSAAKEAHKSYN